jgi:Flp pilus assembly pilin Flp
MPATTTRRPGSRASSSFAYSILTSLRDREDGQALVEYALILMLVAMVSVAGLTAVGVSVSDFLNSFADSF